MTIINKHLKNYEKYRAYYKSPFLMLGNQATNMTISPKEYFKVDDYKTIDPDGGDYSDLTGDVTQLHQQFETVFNLGTIEHIWDAHTAWSNALKLVKVGGYFVGVSPVHGYWRHGIHVTDPVAITTFIKKNGFELLDSYLSHKKGWSINNVADANKGKWATNDVLLWYAAKKIEHKDNIEPVTQIWDAGTNTIDSK